MLSSGFSNATVSKFLVIYFVASSIGLAVFDAKHLAHIQVNPHLWRYGQISRVLLWQAAGYANSTETLFAAILTYQLRVVERMWGSRKFATFILTAFFYTTILTPILLALIIRPLSLNKLNYLPSGPTAAIFAVLAQYHATVPHTFRYQMSTTGNNNNKPSLTLPLSDKSTTYLIAAQLALSQFPTTLLPAAIGWAVGTAWRADFLPSSSPSPRRGAGGRGGWRIPAWLVGEKETRRHESGSREDGERYEDLRRRLEGESAAAAATTSSTASDGTYEQRQRRPLIERFRGVF